MATFHDEVEIEDFEYDENTGVFTYPCPCGDLFSITREQLEDGEDIARLRVIYDEDDFESDDEEAAPSTAPGAGAAAGAPFPAASKAGPDPAATDGADAAAGQHQPPTAAPNSGPAPATDSTADNTTLAAATTAVAMAAG